jgi:cold-inducible RNA-binding protein
MELMNMESKLYVGNLSYETTEDELRSLFTQIGAVNEVVLIKDRDTGSSKGFAFVTMSNEDEAKKAIGQFNGRTMGSRELKVNAAKPREERPSGGYDSNRSGGYRSNSAHGSGNRR